MTQVTDGERTILHTEGAMRIAEKARRAALAAVGLLAITLGFSGGEELPAQPSMQSFSDDFRSAVLNYAHWVIGKINVRGEAFPTSEGLRLTLTVRNITSFFALNVWLNCRIVGDFDAQIRYSLEDWPYRSGIRLGLGVHPNPLPLGSTSLHGRLGDSRGLRTAIAERISLEGGVVTNYPSGGEFYAAEMNGREGRLFPTADWEGQLRLTRVGNDFTAWYWDRGGKLWVPTGRWSMNPKVRDDEWLAIQLWGRERSPNITVYVTDFSIRAQQLVGCPSSKGN